MFLVTGVHCTLESGRNQEFFYFLLIFSMNFVLKHCVKWYENDDISRGMAVVRITNLCSKTPYYVPFSAIFYATRPQQQQHYIRLLLTFKRSRRKLYIFLKIRRLFLVFSEFPAWAAQKRWRSVSLTGGRYVTSLSIIQKASFLLGIIGIIIMILFLISSYYHPSFVTAVDILMKAKRDEIK